MKELTRDMSFAVETGELFVALRPSSTSKFTFLNLILRLEQPDACQRTGLG